MDILLTHGYFLEADPTEQRIMKPYVPLGILSIAAYLEREGFSADVFDSTFETLAIFVQTLEEQRPPVVGIYVNLMTKASALRMIAAAHTRGVRVVVGGPEPAYYTEEFLRHGADVVVIGEGELSLAELLRLPRFSPAALNTVAGIAFRDENGSVVRTAARPLLPNLDFLPMPARSKVSLHRYLDAWNNRHGSSSLSLISMRGCPYTCKWCSHGVYGESYRRRSPQLVVDELAHVHDEYHPDAFWIADDVFTINYRWLFDFANSLRQRALTIRYECITRADRMNEDVVRALKETGCMRLWIGSESGSQRVLDAMSRGVTVEQIQTMTRLAQRAGIEVGMFIMLGYQGETHRDIEATVRHVKKARPDFIMTTTAYPIKGTAFYEESIGNLILPELSFSDWNDRMIDLAGRYSRRFYWFANRRVINEAAWTRAQASGASRLTTMTHAFLKAKAAQVGMYLSR